MRAEISTVTMTWMATLSINGPIAVNRALYRDLPYDPQKDLEPLSLLASGPQILAVHPSVPAKALDEFIARLPHGYDTVLGERGDRVELRVLR